MEIITINSQLIQATAKNLLVEMRMWNEKKNKLKAVLWTKFTYFDIKTQRAAVHSEELSNLFELILLPVDQSSFEERKSFLIRSQPMVNT